VAGPDRHLVADLDLAPEMHQKGAIRDGTDADSRHSPQPADDLLGVDAVPRLDGDVALGSLAGGLDQVDGADVPPGVADRRCYATEHSWAVGDLKPDDEAVARARGNHGRQFYPLWSGPREVMAVPTGGTPGGSSRLVDDHGEP